jgi:ribosomal protein L37E
MSAKAEKFVRRVTERGVSHHGQSSGTAYLIRCHRCGQENYAPAVATGTCAWCGADANWEEGEGQ